MLARNKILVASAVLVPSCLADGGAAALEALAEDAGGRCLSNPSTVRSDPLLDSLLAHCEERGLVRPVSGGDEARGVVQPFSGSPKPFEQPQS